MQIFDTESDYRLFEKLLWDAKELTDMRILAYVLMPNHWHLVLYPKNDGDLGMFMRRLTNAHTRHVHTRTKTVGSGHLYQERYKSFIVDTDNDLLALITYVERNPPERGWSVVARNGNEGARGAASTARRNK
ncbi:MAG: transposase [Patescibacteria group bacterium]